MIEHIELSDRIYLQVKKMIFDQELKPGQKILQEKLSAELGVSRTPLLKALQQLENEMLVESIPRRGLYVKALQPQEVVDVFQIREVIEGLSARLAAQRMTPDQAEELRRLFAPFEKQQPINRDEYAKADRAFHDMLLKSGGNRVLPRLEMLGNIQLLAYQVGLLRSPEETLPEHLSIIDALAAGDGEAAETLMRGHIRRSLEAMAKRSNASNPAEA